MEEEDGKMKKAGTGWLAGWARRKGERREKDKA